MDCDSDVGDEGGVPLVTVPWTALQGDAAATDGHVVDLGSHSAHAPCVTAVTLLAPQVHTSGRIAKKAGVNFGQAGVEWSAH